MFCGEPLRRNASRTIPAAAETAIRSERRRRLRIIRNSYRRRRRQKNALISNFQECASHPLPHKPLCPTLRTARSVITIIPIIKYNTHLSAVHITSRRRVAGKRVNYQSLFQTIRNAMARNARAVHALCYYNNIVVVVSVHLRAGRTGTCPRRKVDAGSLTLAFLRLVTVKMSGTKTPLGKRRRRIKDGGGGGGKSSSFRRVVSRNCACHRQWNFSAAAHRVIEFSCFLPPYAAAAASPVGECAADDGRRSQYCNNIIIDCRTRVIVLMIVLYRVIGRRRLQVENVFLRIAKKTNISKSI